MLLLNLAVQFQKGSSSLHLGSVAAENAVLLETQWLFSVFFTVY